MPSINQYVEPSREHEERMHEEYLKKQFQKNCENLPPEGRYKSLQVFFMNLIKPHATSYLVNLFTQIQNTLGANHQGMDFNGFKDLFNLTQTYNERADQALATARMLLRQNRSNITIRRVRLDMSPNSPNRPNRLNRPNRPNLGVRGARAAVKNSVAKLLR